MTDLELLESILLGDKNKRKEKPEWVSQTDSSPQVGGMLSKPTIPKPSYKVKLNKYQNVSRLFKDQVGLILDNEEGRVYGIKYCETNKARQDRKNKERQDNNSKVLREYNIKQKERKQDDIKQDTDVAKIIPFTKKKT
jgi:hypothetical protein